MKVILHQTIRVHPNLLALRQREKSGEEIPPIRAVAKNLPPLDPAADVMISAAFDFNS